MTDARPTDDPPAIADELVQALRLATEYILMLQPAMGSIDADVRRMVHGADQGAPGAPGRHQGGTVKPRPICLHCDEPITDDDIAWTPVFFRDGRVETREQHTVCAMRALVGGLNHLRGRCTCCGGDEPPDPPGMSRYEAAKAAVAYFWQRNAGVEQ